MVITFKKNASHENTNYESFLDKFLKAKNPNRAAYIKLVEKKQKQPVNGQTKWSVDCMIEENKTIDWKTANKLPFNVQKYQNFWFFNLNSYTGDWPLIISYKKINLNDNDLCSFRQLEEETLIHLFWNCTVTSSFWNNFKQWLLNNETSLRSLELMPSLVIGLKPHPFLRKYFYFLFLVAKTLHLDL